jgi:hypothetical protein
MKLNTNNYYGKNANKEYMSVSQYKEFNKCEACAMAQIKGIYEKPKTSALFLGSFVDELLTGTRKSQIKFIAENIDELFQKSSKFSKVARSDILAVVTENFKDLFQADNKPYAEIVQALETVERIKKQPLMMEHLSGKHQKIMTGEIAGVPFKIKMDSFHPDKTIVDFKYMASLRSPNMFEPMVKYWGYDIQGAIYQEIVYQNTGKRLPFYLNIATKEKPAHLSIAEIMQYDLDEALENVIKNAPRYQAIKNGEIEPERCEDYNCDYCAETVFITEPIDSNFLGLPKRG